MRIGHAMLASAILIGASADPGAVRAKEVNVVLFAGASAMPIYVAQDKGFFDREGLKVNVTPTPSSGYQMSNLIAGKYHIAHTAVDNLIAYQEGQGTAKIEKEPDLVTLMGLASTELVLMAQPSIKTINELKGRELALDSPSTGFAFVLRNMLEKRGIGPNDVKFVPFGGTRERLQALRDGKAAAALMTQPFTTQAMKEGFSFLGEGVSELGAYQATVLIANRHWAKENDASTVGFIRAILAGIDWIYNPSNTDEAVRILAGRTKISEASARPSIEGLTKGQSALARTGQINLEGLRNVIALREKYGEPQRKLGGPERYYDASWYEKALRK